MDHVLGLADLAAQARGRRPVVPVLTEVVRAELAEGGRTLAVAAREGAVYGLSTGVGALRDVAVDVFGDGGVGGAAAGLRLWRSHAADLGPELDEAEARATMLVRLHQLATGSTGVSVGLATGLERALVGGAVPVLRGYGSIGTGDLTVLAQLALALAGEGRWRAGAPQAVVPEASDALPFISSNAMTAGLGLLAHEELTGLLDAAERVASVSFLALRGSDQAYDARVHARKDDPAAAAAARRMSALVAGAPGPAARVQDPFCLRTIPQVHAVADDALGAAGRAVLAEVRAAGENPLPIEGAVLHHGQFLTQRLAAAFDAVATAAIGVATLAQTRLAALVDPRLTGLAPFLAVGPPGSSGVMILEYVAADVTARLRASAVPATPTRTPLSIGMEEIASHSTQAVLAARAVARLLPDLLACELVAAVRAVRMEPGRAAGSSRAARLAREAAGTLGEAPLEDHVLGDELRTAAGLIRAWADAR